MSTARSVLAALALGVTAASCSGGSAPIPDPCPGAAPPAAAAIDPGWAAGARMVDLLLHDGYPATSAQIVNDVAGLESAVDEAADNHASVVQIHFADEFLYADWVDETGFAKNKATLAAVVAHAHARGLRAIVYMNGLEVMTPGANPAPSPKQGFDPAVPSMRRDHPDWLQHTVMGQSIGFSGIPAAEAGGPIDYLHGADWEDAWMCPLTGWRGFFLGRVTSVMQTGADGVFVDVAFLPGLPELITEYLGDAHAQVGACFNAACTAAFAARNPGLKAPGVGNYLAWGDDGWDRFVRFRYELIRDYYGDILQAVRAIRPDGLVLAETSANDVPSAAVTFGNDNTQAPVGVTPELAPPSSAQCAPDAYADFLAMAKYARAENRQHAVPFVPLGSADHAGDRMIQFGILASTAGSYFTFGAQIADLGGLFAFLEAHQDTLVASAPAARVAVLFSPHTRDFVDRLAGDAYNPAGPHFGEYRAVLRLLADRHVPYEILFPEDATAAELAGYAAIVAPDVECLSDAAGARLAALPSCHRIVLTGATATRDLWGHPRAQQTIARATSLPPVAGTSGAALIDALGGAAGLVTLAGHGLHDAEPVLVDVDRPASGAALAVHLINLTGATSGDCVAEARPIKGLTLQVSRPGISRARLFSPSPGGVAQPSISVEDGGARITLDALPGYALLLLD